MSRTGTDHKRSVRDDRGYRVREDSIEVARIYHAAQDRPYAMQTSISGHIFDYVAIPDYSTKDPLHRKVVEVAKQCHLAAAAGQTGQPEDLEEKLGQAAAEVLKLPTAKLKVMRDELQLLRGTVAASPEQDD